MNLVKNNLTIRNATSADAEQLCIWWNDGNVMAHAGFPNGLGIAAEEVHKSISANKDETNRLHIIEFNNKSIGEMHYRNKGNGIAKIGIKICEPSEQEKGLGTTLLTMFIDALFTYYGYEKIILDANKENTRAWHVYENKLGFKRLRVNENSWTNQLGEPQTSIDYELTKVSWLSYDKRPNYLHLRTERPEDYYAVEEISRDAHWDGNWETEPCVSDIPLLVHRLRQCSSYLPELHYVAELDGKLVGHIMYTKAKIVPSAKDNKTAAALVSLSKDDSGKEHEMLTFGPLSVLPNYQNMGIGKVLMQHSFGVAKRLGYRAVFIFGHPDYYPRAGFCRAAEFNVSTADGSNFDPFMAYPLYEGVLDGIQGCFHIDPVYDDLSWEDTLEYDKKFPLKELYVPVPIEVLIDRLPPAARKSFAGFEGKSIKFMTTKSERDVASMDGVDDETIEIIRNVMLEHNFRWGTK